MVGLPDVRSCCGCCTVETGAKIIAWIQVILGLGLLIYNLELLGNLLYFRETINKTYFHMNLTFTLVVCLYPMLQGTILMIGIKKKKAALLLIWLILAIIFEVILTSLLTIFYAYLLTIIYGFASTAIILYGSGIQIGISFFFMVIVSTCRKNIIRQNTLFDFGVLYTPAPANVQILNPKQPKGIFSTNSQFDYAVLDVPEDAIVT